MVLYVLLLWSDARLTETYPKKMTNHMMATVSHVPAAREHGGHQQPGREGLRPIVVRRKISGQMGSVKGMRKMGILFTCLLAWRKRSPNSYRELDRALAPK